MGFFRGGLLIFVSTLLLFSLIGMNHLFIITSSLEYDNIKEVLISSANSESLQDVLHNFFKEDFDIINQESEIFEKARQYCEGNTDYIFSLEGRTITIPCDKIQQGSGAVINETISDFVEDVYYGEYNCDFWNCFAKEKTPFFLISEKAKNYWQEKMYYALLMSFVFVILIFFLIENKKNFPIVFGSILLISSLPLLKAESLISYLVGSFSSLFLLILISLKLIFWISFIIGLIFIVFGIALKVMNLKILEMFSKDKNQTENKKDKTDKEKLKSNK